MSDVTEGIFIAIVALVVMLLIWAATAAYYQNDIIKGYPIVVGTQVYKCNILETKSE